MPVRPSKRNIKTDLDAFRPYIIGGGAAAARSLGANVSTGEGPGIDVVGGNTVGIGGDTILLYDSGGLPVAEFAATDAGLTAALAAMAAGDVVELPAVTISGGPWTVSAGTLRGMSREGSILNGQVTVNDATALETLTIERSEDDAGAIYGVVDGGGTAKLVDVTVNVANATGPAYAVYVAADGSLYAYDCALTAEMGSSGYAAYVSLGRFYQIGGLALGTAPGLPYWRS